jgi:hypothetical protein
MKAILLRRPAFLADLLSLPGSETKILHCASTIRIRSSLIDNGTSGKFATLPVDSDVKAQTHVLL